MKGKKVHKEKQAFSNILNTGGRFVGQRKKVTTLPKPLNEISHKNPQTIAFRDLILGEYDKHEVITSLLSPSKNTKRYSYFKI